MIYELPKKTETIIYLSFTFATSHSADEGLSGQHWSQPPEGDNDALASLTGSFHVVHLSVVYTDVASLSHVREREAYF